jgi:serine/threonine protein kinase
LSKTGFREYMPGAVVRNGERVYAVAERISRGKFGCAFACQDDWGYSRILQVVWPFSHSYENEREKWSQQAAELQRVRHPDLVHLLDGFEHDGCFHLVHERCDDRLDRLIVSPAWDGRRWLKAVARPVLCALDAAHRSGYAHRNLHPHNVLCTVHLEQVDPDSVPSGALKLGDLAVNTLLGKVEVLNTKLARSMVPPEYLSPSECGPMDHRLDIYQAGLLLLCVLQGRILHYSFEEISTGLPAKHADALEPGYGQAVARALQLRVTDRFPSALAFWQALSGPRPTSAGGAESIFR